MTNETAFNTFYPAVSGIGGIVLGVGFFQNINLAVTANASGLVVIDRDPMVTLTLALLLPFLPNCETRQKFAQAVEEMMNPERPTDRCLAFIPSSYQPVFSEQLHGLRTPKSSLRREVGRVMKMFLEDPSTFLGNDSSYTLAAELVRTGGVSIIYGGLTDPELPDLVSAALAVHHDPVRVIYLSNALEWLARSGASSMNIQSVLRILEASETDPQGRLLMTTEFASGRDEAIRFRQGDGFTYHARTIEESRTVLRREGHFAELVRHCQRDPKIVPVSG